MKTFISISVIAIAAFLWGGILLSPTSAQRRAQAFSHSTPAHKNGQYANCNVCHQLPTSSWTAPRRDKLPPFPDVTTYPNPHPVEARNVCFTCHSPFERGGVLCGTCHTIPSMRATKALVPFPDPRRARQFNTVFPHDVHQDLIATNRMRSSDVAVAHFVPASFAAKQQKTAPDFYNCAVCHQTASQALKFAPRPLPSLKPLGNIVADTFESPVNAGFFKDSPEGHASCFNCHYQNQYLPAGKQNCAGCHELTKPYVENKTILRYSIKFDHDRKEHADRDCASCHIRITQNSDIKLLKNADVPVSACWSCHATSEETRYRRILGLEIEARDASIAKKEKPFQCIYCHTSAIGRFDVPATHRKP